MIEKGQLPRLFLFTITDVYSKILVIILLQIHIMKPILFLKCNIIYKIKKNAILKIKCIQPLNQIEIWTSQNWEYLPQEI